MKRHIHSRVGTTLLFLLLLSLPAAAQISDVYVLPAMGNTPGAGGTFWVNDFHIMNPQPHALKVTLTYIPTGAGQAKAFTLTINSNETQWTENILKEFASNQNPNEMDNRTGSLLVWVDPEDNPTVPDDPASLGVIVASRSFNDRPTGTVGQGVPGVMTGLADYDLDQISAIATGANNWGAISVNGFRTNVGGVNLSDVSTTLWVSVIDDAGTEIARWPFSIPPGTHYQAPLPTTIEHGTLEFWVQFPNDYTPTFSDLVVPYASVVDNRTGDPTYLNPTLLAVPGVLWGKQGAAQVRTPARVTAAAVRGLVGRAAQLGEAHRRMASDGKGRIVGPGRAE